MLLDNMILSYILINLSTFEKVIESVQFIFVVPKGKQSGAQK